MKDHSLTRRNLLGALAFTTTSTALGAVGINLNSLLRGSEGEAKVKAVLKKHFEPTAGPLNAPFVTAFYQSLLLAKAHRQSQQFFLDLLDTKELEERLEIYVIEEFVTTTNYMMVLAGTDKDLKMLN